MQFSSEEGLPETAVKARKRQFMTTVAIISHLENSVVKFYDSFIILGQSTGPVIQQMSTMTYTPT